MVRDSQWLNLQEASQITGKSVNSLRLLIKRKKFDRVKKTSGKYGEEWLIHADSLKTSDQNSDRSSLVLTKGNEKSCQKPEVSPGQIVTLPAEIYLQQKKEYDQAVQGLMMYRYKYEEIERKVKLLPSPVETITSKLEELERTIKEQAIRLQEEQQARMKVIEELQKEKRKPWWKNILKGRF